MPTRNIYVLAVVSVVAAVVAAAATGQGHDLGPYAGDAIREVLYAPFTSYYGEFASLYGGNMGPAAYGRLLAIPAAIPSTAERARILLYLMDEETQLYGPSPVDAIDFGSVGAAGEIGVTAVALDGAFLAAAGTASGGHWLRVYVRNYVANGGADTPPLFTERASFVLGAPPTDVELQANRIFVSTAYNRTEAFVRTGIALWNRSEYLPVATRLASYIVAPGSGDAREPPVARVFLLSEGDEESGAVLAYEYAGARGPLTELPPIRVPYGAYSLAASPQRGLVAVGNREIGETGIYADTAGKGAYGTYTLAQTILDKQGSGWAVAFGGYSETLFVSNPIAALSDQQITALKEAGYDNPLLEVMLACDISQYVDFGESEAAPPYFQLVATKSLVDDTFSWPMGYFLRTDTSAAAIGDLVFTPVPSTVPVVAVFDGTAGGLESVAAA